MNILISGGTGLIGTAFSYWVQHHINLAQSKVELDSDPQTVQNSMSDNQVQITWLTRDVNQAHPDFIDVMSYEQLQKTGKSFDVILNLAGAEIADKRWSDARRQTLMQSRLKPTVALIDYIARIENKPKLMLSGSAIGWYGNQGDTPLDENSPSDVQGSDDFAHQLCAAWESKAKEALAFDVPVIILRTGIVIHPDGGMLAKLLPSFKMGMGGQLGDGNQVMSWISLTDWVRAAWHIIQYHLNPRTAYSGSVNDEENQQSSSSAYAVVYNLTAPDPVINAVFTQIIGNWLHRPTFMTLPAWLLKLMFGDMASLLIYGQKVLPKQLLEAGFKFEYIALKQALVEQHSITNLS